jgi:hypothetical protein
MAKTGKQPGASEADFCAADHKNLADVWCIRYFRKFSRLDPRSPIKTGQERQREGEKYEVVGRAGA